MKTILKILILIYIFIIDSNIFIIANFLSLKKSDVMKCIVFCCCLACLCAQGVVVHISMSSVHFTRCF